MVVSRADHESALNCYHAANLLATSASGTTSACWLLRNQCLLRPSYANPSCSSRARSASLGLVNLSPSRCTTAWQEALKDGKVGISDCYAASKLGTPQEQDALLSLKLSGASRDQIEQQGRKARTSKTPAVKVARVKCELPGNICVVVSGEAVSLDDSIEALGEAIKAMRRARDEGYTAKTFAAAMRDRSKKAGA